MVSYIEIRHMVLDSFYSYLLDKPKGANGYESILGYTLYDFETGFSDIEVFIIDFVVYVLCHDFPESQDLAKTLKKSLLKRIDYDFAGFIRQIKPGIDDREEFLADVYSMGLISEQRRQGFNK